MTGAQLQADRALVFDDFPTETIIIGIGTYSCLVAGFARGNNLEVGGLAPDYDLEVLIKRSELHNARVDACIQEGNRAVFRNELFSVSRVREDDARATVIVQFRFAGARQPVNPLLSAEGNWLTSADGQVLEG